MNNCTSQSAHRKARRGAAALATTLLIGGLIIEIGLVATFLFYLLNFTNYGVRLSAEGIAGAAAGVDDGFLKVVRNKCFITLPAGYDFDLGSNNMTVRVSVERPAAPPTTCTDVTSGVETRVVTATASLFTKRRRMQGTAEVDMKTGLVNIVRREEVPL